MRIPCAPHAAHLWGPYGFYHDAACRVVIPLYAISVYARMGINDGRWQCPAMPTVGAGSSQREDSPARRLHPPPWHTMRPSRLPSMRIYGLYHAPLVREGTRERAGNFRPAPTASPLPRSLLIIAFPCRPREDTMRPACLPPMGINGLYSVAPRRYKKRESSSPLVGRPRGAIGKVDDAAVAEARFQQKPYRVVIQRVRISP